MGWWLLKLFDWPLYVSGEACKIIQKLKVNLSGKNDKLFGDRFWSRMTLSHYLKFHAGIFALGITHTCIFTVFRLCIDGPRSVPV